VGAGRPIGIEIGLDLQFKLDHHDRFGLTRELEVRKRQAPGALAAARADL
jgi:hypothetical protein